jgi:hypothetical protein
MMKRFRPVGFACSLLVGFAAASFAQARPPEPPKNPIEQGAAAAQEVRQRDLASIVPLKVHIVLSRYQGDKKINSLPYELTVRTDGTTSNIRMNAQVPVLQNVFIPPTKPSPTPTAGAEPPAPPTPLRNFNYKDIGTNIDCRATNLDAGRFAVTVTIEDSSVYKPEVRPSAGAARGDEELPTFRTFRSLNSMVLKDGQSTEFNVATDKMTGEVVKAEVSIAVGK